MAVSSRVRERGERGEKGEEERGREQKKERGKGRGRKDTSACFNRIGKLGVPRPLVGSHPLAAMKEGSQQSAESEQYVVSPTVTSEK